MHKIIQVHIILLLIFVYLLPVEVGDTRTSTWQHLVYIFFHANIFHLIGNCYCTYYILNNRTYTWTHTLILIYTLALIASLITYNTLPTMGFSAPLFVMLGINFHSSAYKKRYIVLLLTVITSWLFIPYLNTSLHVICFFLGYLYTRFNHFIKGIRYDCTRIGK